MSELDCTLANEGDLIDHLLYNEQLNAQDTVMVGDREHDIIGTKWNDVRSLECYGATKVGKNAKKLVQIGLVSIQMICSIRLQLFG